MGSEILLWTCGALAVLGVLAVLMAWQEERARERDIGAIMDRAKQAGKSAGDTTARQIGGERWINPSAHIDQMRKARDSRITRHDGTNSFCLAAAAAYPTRLPADDCRVIGMDMAQAADATMLSLVTHGAAVSTIHAADDCVRVTPVDIGSAFACEPSYSSSDYGSSSSSDSYSTPSE